jgi:hypothetical protein
MLEFATKPLRVYNYFLKSRDMGLTGCASVADITPALIRDKFTTTPML